MLRANSIERLLLVHGLMSLILVATSAGIGGGLVYLQHRATEQSIRDTELQRALQALRGDLYRQMKEVYDHVFIQDPDAPAVFDAYAFRIEGNLETLRQLASATPRRNQIDQLQAAYHRIRTRAQVLMQRATDTYADGELFRLFNSDLEGERIFDYENALGEVERGFRDGQRDIAIRIARLDWWALPILLGPIVLAAVLLLSARLLLQRKVAVPLAGLLAATQAFSSGQMEHQVAETGPVEFLALQRAFNHMARELRLSREALVRSETQSALGALVPVIAHNIRNPLAGIRATAQVIDAPGHTADDRAALRGVIATVDRLENWLSSLLSYLNPSNARYTSVQLSAVVRSAADLVAHHAEAKEVGIAYGPVEEAAVIWGDPNLLEQAVCGLITNAIDASATGGQVVLSVDARGDDCRISIADDGPGMPFAAGTGDLAPGPTTKPFGVGLGVPFARKVSELHRGRLTYDRRAPKGTLACLRFSGGGLPSLADATR